MYFALIIDGSRCCSDSNGGHIFFSPHLVLAGNVVKSRLQMTITAGTGREELRARASLEEDRNQIF